MHDLRHSFASAMVNSSMNLYDVKEILVDTNIKTTQRYAHQSNAKLKKAASSVVDYYEQCNEQDWTLPRAPPRAPPKAPQIAPLKRIHQHSALKKTTR